VGSEYGTCFMSRFRHLAFCGASYTFPQICASVIIRMLCFYSGHCLRQIVDSVQHNILVKFLYIIFLSKKLRNVMSRYSSLVHIPVRVKQILNYGFVFLWRNNIHKLYVYMEPSFG